MKPILRMLHSKVIPWTKSEDRRLVSARPIMKNVDLPSGTSLSRHPLKGKRVIVKHSRVMGNQRAFNAFWPEANQQEMALPKLACVVNGSADYLLGNYCLHANEGTFILIPQHAPHHHRGPFLDEARRQSGDCTLLFAYAYSHGIYFWFSRSANGHHVNEETNRYSIPNAAAVQIFNLVMEEAVSAQTQFEPVCKSLLFVFFTILSREIEAERYMSPVPQEHTDAKILTEGDFTSQVQEYIRANLHKRLKVEDAATQMYLSSSHFSRMIRQETGTSFVELLTRCRIERAQELLKETDWTVIFIAGYVGLKSTAYFHDLFHHRVGCSPIEYRLKHRK